MTKNTAANEQAQAEPHIPDFVELSQKMAKIAERSQKLMQDFMDRQKNDGEMPNMDPMKLGHAFQEFTKKLMANPQKIFELQMSFARDTMALWQYTTQRMLGQAAEPVIREAKDDRRFKDANWNESTIFDFIKQSYLLTVDWMQRVEHSVEIEPDDSRKLTFAIRQLSDAISPSNFALTNPEVLKKTLDTGGENLVKGLENLLSDLERGRGQLLIKMTDPEAFKLGESLAATPGKVVFQNDMMQLLQYTPTTEKVHKRPLLIIPPWINKFYILDMREKNSFVRWAVEQGHTVFLLSWINPDATHKDKSFEDYMQEGILTALDKIEEQTGEKSINAIGYCLGGTLLACALAYLKVKKQEDRIASATYFVTLIDFKEAGDIKLFIDESQISEMEAKMKANGGYLDAQSMHTTFNLLRPNDLIWSFVVNNYLLGKEPFPFDLLYWNGDSTRLPATMHSFYLRNMYMQNKLIEKGGISLKGVPIDLTIVETPSFMLSTREDHISPWESTYLATQIYGGKKNKFVLSGSGHIAGVINAPGANKYYYLTNSSDTMPKTSQEWLAGAVETAGSWWPEWQRWIEQYTDGQTTPRDPANGKLKVVEDAPGSYVKVRAL